MTIKNHLYQIGVPITKSKVVWCQQSSQSHLRYPSGTSNDDPERLYFSWNIQCFSVLNSKYLHWRRLSP